MRNTKEMLEDIRSAMNRALDLSVSEDVTEKHRAFYKMVSEPLLLRSNCNDGLIRNIVCEAMKSAIGFILNAASGVRLSYQLERYNHVSTDTTTRGKFEVTLYVRKDGEWLDFLEETIEIPRAIKHTKALSLLIETLTDKIKNHKEMAGEFDLYNECFTSAWLQYRVKLLANEIKANTGDLWMYFTDNNYYEHYSALNDTQNLHSCMAYQPSHYGSSINGNYIHPLQGYDYTPDFRLGLVSAYSPSEIDDVTEYPFIARVIVSYDYQSKPKLSYGKAYGNEKATTMIRNCLVNYTPIGRVFYAVKANHLASHLNNGDDCDFNLQGYYNDGETEYESMYYRKSDDDILGHFIAPFVDPWANFFDYIGRVYRHPITGLEVINCMVKENNDWYDEDEDRTVYDEGYCIHHGTGIVRPKDDWDDTYSVLIETTNGLRHL